MIAFAFTLLFAATAPQIPPAIFTDPPHDAAHPAQMVVLHIPSGGVEINGIAYLPPGAGPHPAFVFMHGLPGNEKNLDLVQAVRRAGWAAIAFNYRGSWGSPGSFRFAENLEDADAVLAYIRDPANARKLGIDTSRIVIAGHSMGGWVAAMTTGHDRNLRGVILISAANMGGRSGDRTKLIEHMREDMESLAGVTAESMADELIANAKSFDWTSAVPGLARTPLLVLTANDGLAPQDDALVDAVKTAGNAHLTTTHVATDHSWSDARIKLESLVIRWLETLR